MLKKYENRPGKVPEMSTEQKKDMDKFVLKRFKKLGPELFHDGMVAADATLANVVYILDNYVILPEMIRDSRKRLGLHIMKKFEYHPRCLLTYKMSKIELDTRSGMMAIKGK
jgi:hypothetical protein